KSTAMTFQKKNPEAKTEVVEIKVQRNPDKLLDAAVVKVKQLDDEMHDKPTYANEFAAGADLYACHNFLVKRGETTLIRTGLALEIPPGFEGQVRPRSGLALNNGVFILNS